MKLVMKTGRKVAFEVEALEIEKVGFDYIWDKIRTQYPEDEFDMYSIEAKKIGEDIIFIELTPKSIYR